ncbi:MAG: hypothetical protein ACI8ZB_001712 [Desulforhopalus sp.]|jgi:hypothetical protein
MRWSYKTVHYELKKEGLLGSSFLDESEVELSLNEYGKSGWELISMLETMDGLIAVFKQPLSLESESFYPPVEDEVDEDALLGEEQFIVEPLSREDNHTYDDEVVLVEDFDVVEELETKVLKEKKRPVANVDVGTIVIE